jgi:hypothetical protein
LFSTTHVFVHLATPKSAAAAPFYYDIFCRPHSNSEVKAVKQRNELGQKEHCWATAFFDDLEKWTKGVAKL